MSEQICASCYFYYPCPCGQCLYGTCKDTAIAAIVGNREYRERTERGE